MSYEQYLVDVKKGIVTDQGNCPVTPLLQKLQGKWKSQILYELCIHDPARFGEIKKDLPGISNATLSNVLKELEESYGIKNYRFHITLPQSSPVLPVIEKKIKEFGFEDRIVNHGNLKQQDLAILYRSCKISFLPSVLEVFSASTIESMYFQLPTVATNLSFNTEVFADSCLYYTPKNFKGAASQIVQTKNYVVNCATR